MDFVFKIDAKSIVGITIFFILVAIEAYVSIYKKKRLYEKTDTIMNIALALITYITKELVVKASVLSSFLYFNQFALFQFESSILSWLILFFLNDLLFYFFHRLSHESRIFWAAHLVHHSSQYFNFTTSMRGIFIIMLYRFAFWIPLALLGFGALEILLVDQIAFFYQLFLHTKLVNRLHPVIEFIFNTPSHHRVHHGSNPNYLDKNHGAVFIIWDRIFGTFQKEDEEVVYGLTSPVNEKSFIDVSFGSYVSLFKGLKQAATLKEKLKYMFKSPAWKPVKKN